eukprot:g2099.t1
MQKQYPTPCNLYWDAIYDLKGKETLSNDEVPIGGEWPWFLRVCSEKLEKPRNYTQWVEYLNPREIADETRNPMGHKLKDVLCDGQQCFLDGDLHPIRLEPLEPCKDPQKKCDGVKVEDMLQLKKMHS